MPLDTMAVLLALGLLAACLAGAPLPGRTDRSRHDRPLNGRRRVVAGLDWLVSGIPHEARAGTPDDGPLGLGAGRTTRCPVCARAMLELVTVSVAPGGDVPRVRCGACLSTYAVRGTLSTLPQQRGRS